MEKKLKEGLVSEIKPIRDGMKIYPKSIKYPEYPSITVYDDDVEEEKDAFILEIAEQYMRTFSFVSDTSAFNRNKLIDRSSVSCPTASNANKIQTS